MKLRSLRLTVTMKEVLRDLTLDNDDPRLHNAPRCRWAQHTSTYWALAARGLCSQYGVLTERGLEVGRAVVLLLAKRDRQRALEAEAVENARAQVAAILECHGFLLRPSMRQRWCDCPVVLGNVDIDTQKSAEIRRFAALLERIE